jgi:hypothetical protein
MEDDDEGLADDGVVVEDEVGERVADEIAIEVEADDVAEIRTLVDVADGRVLVDVVEELDGAVDTVETFDDAGTEVEDEIEALLEEVKDDDALAALEIALDVVDVESTAQTFILQFPPQNCSLSPPHRAEQSPSGTL